MKRAVFLDRDNTIIHADDDVSEPAAVRLIDGAAEAIASLVALGYRIIIVTNQGGVARGLLTEADVGAVNSRIADLVERRAGARIERFYYCPYHPEATLEQYRREHPWRKPNPGMLLRAARDLDLDLGACWMVGDSMRDVEAGRAAGARTVLLSELSSDDAARIAGDAGPDHITRNLAEAARLIARETAGAVADRESSEPGGAEATASPDPAASAGPDASFGASPPPPGAGRSAAPAPPSPSPRLSAARGFGDRRTAAPSAPDAADEAAGGDRQPPPPPRPPADESIPDLLRQVLRELKGRRVQYDDLTFTRMVAGIVQIIALGCLVFGMLNADEPMRFLQWLAGALVGQLIVITLLLAERPPRPPT